MLFLDEERQRSKEHPEKPLRKNHTDPLGIRRTMVQASSKKATAPDSDPVNIFNMFIDSAGKSPSSPKYKFIVDYMLGFGKTFFNAAGRQVVKRGIAREETVEEAKKHILRAKELGLNCNAEMVEGEQFIWGLENSEMNEFRMFCFCCPCCCLAMKVIKNASREAKNGITAADIRQQSIIINALDAINARKSARNRRFPTGRTGNA